MATRSTMVYLAVYLALILVALGLLILVDRSFPNMSTVATLLFFGATAALAYLMQPLIKRFVDIDGTSTKKSLPVSEAEDRDTTK